jgi:hypothetical protein
VWLSEFRLAIPRPSMGMGNFKKAKTEIHLFKISALDSLHFNLQAKSVPDSKQQDGFLGTAIKKSSNPTD